MAAFAIKTSAVSCREAMGIIDQYPCCKLSEPAPASRAEIPPLERAWRSPLLMLRTLDGPHAHSTPVAPPLPPVPCPCPLPLSLAPVPGPVLSLGPVATPTAAQHETARAPDAAMFGQVRP